MEYKITKTKGKTAPKGQEGFCKDLSEEVPSIDETLEEIDESVTSATQHGEMLKAKEKAAERQSKETITMRRPRTNGGCTCR